MSRPNEGSADVAACVLRKCVDMACETSYAVSARMASAISAVVGRTETVGSSTAALSTCAETAGDIVGATRFITATPATATENTVSSSVRTNNDVMFMIDSSELSF